MSWTPRKWGEQIARDCNLPDEDIDYIELAIVESVRDAEARVAALEAALRDARTALVVWDKAEDARLEAVSQRVDEGLIERHCDDDCPQDDTCECPDTQMVGRAINGTLNGRVIDPRIGSVADLVRTIDRVLGAALSTGGKEQG